MYCIVVDTYAGCRLPPSDPQRLFAVDDASAGSPMFLTKVRKSPTVATPQQKHHPIPVYATNPSQEQSCRCRRPSLSATGARRKRHDETPSRPSSTFARSAGVLRRVLGLGLVVLITFGVLWAPFCVLASEADGSGCLSSLAQVRNRRLCVCGQPVCLRKRGPGCIPLRRYIASSCSVAAQNWFAGADD